MKLCVRTSGADETRSVKNRIWQLDQRVEFGKEGNPVTFWVETKLDVGRVAEIEGVLDVIESETGK